MRVGIGGISDKGDRLRIIIIIDFKVVKSENLIGDKIVRVEK